jgi:hypothetical protein
MRFTIAAGILAQTLPVVSEERSANELLLAREQEKKHDIHILLGNPKARDNKLNNRARLARKTRRPSSPPFMIRQGNSSKGVLRTKISRRIALIRWRRILLNAIHRLLM